MFYFFYQRGKTVSIYSRVGGIYIGDFWCKLPRIKKEAFEALKQAQELLDDAWGRWKSARQDAKQSRQETWEARREAWEVRVQRNIETWLEEERSKIQWQERNPLIDADVPEASLLLKRPTSKIEIKIIFGHIKKVLEEELGDTTNSTSRKHNCITT